MKSQMKGRDFLTVWDFSKEEIETILDLAFRLKSDIAAGIPHEFLKNKTLFMLFYNRSLRTRNSFEVGMTQLGGHANYLDPEKVYTPAMEGEEQAFATERISDVARVLARYGEGIAIRLFGDPTGWRYKRGNQILKEFAYWADVPVINMEDDVYHPCQGMADLMTMVEKLGDLQKKKIVMSWAYSPSIKKPVSVPHSVMTVSSFFGAHIVFARPDGFELDPEILDKVKENTRRYGGTFEETNNMREAFAGADVVYPKCWPSLKFMPPATDEFDAKAQTELFTKNRDWICDMEKLRIASPDVFYMHCLPCDRGFEVTDEVADGPNSVIFDQAENRLHVQKAIMVLTMK